MEAAYPFFLPSCNCVYFPSKNNIKGMMDYDWLPWIFTEGVIVRVACLNVKRMEHQGEQKSCLKTSSHCKKRNQVSYVRWRCTTPRTPWGCAYSSDISPDSGVNNLKHKFALRTLCSTKSNRPDISYVLLRQWRDVQLPSQFESFYFPHICAFVAFLYLPFITIHHATCILTKDTNTFA